MEEELLLLQGSSVAVPPLESNKYSWPSESDFGTTEELMMMGDLVDEAAAVSSSSLVQQQLEQEEPRRRRESMLNKLISTVYSGPTISDIESALSFTGGDQLAAAVDARNYNSAGPVYVARARRRIDQLIWCIYIYCFRIVVVIYWKYQIA